MYDRQVMPDWRRCQGIFDWECMTLRSYPNGEDTRDIFDWENMTLRSYPTGEDAKSIFDQTARFVSFGQ
jgi:hypothetical protein